MERLQYGSHANQHVLLINSTQPLTRETTVPALIYIHGGAWTDPNNTSSDILSLSKSLNKTIPLASVDYRLTPEVQYPAHINDVVAGIECLLTKKSLTRISLAGHSVGATLVLQLLEEWRKGGKNIADIVDSVYLLDGIYDLDDLVDEYPDYEGFIKNAHEDYKAVSKLNLQLLKDVKVHIVHSYQDELLSLRQTNWLSNRLQTSSIEFKLYLANLGKHDEVYSEVKLAKYINTTFY